ncbi:hypothetical protein OH76DRAFT_1095791 [Lentinus brumalis]|uniref:F-box domain-containing protein n=1 Tax=Lentinus brumalis TaxID=2498619 RepID=A0A371CW34_9APHY|nr:hypothetical protein OH76DRAFT_1095791 [Polyporus brumalis]
MADQVSRESTRAGMDAPQGQHIELPAELWDITIDMLRADTRTLKSCSLVCREWTHRAQHRLFNLLSHTWPRPRGGREPAERTAPGTQEELTSFLYASPHIARHVITFVLDSDAPGCYRTLSIPKLSAILSCFPALRKLELRSVEILDEPFRNIAGDRRISPLCHSVGLLKSLSLRRCRVITLLALYGFLALFPSITYLALVDVKMNLSAFDEAGTSSLLATKLIPSGLALKTLHITYAPRSLLSALIRDIKSMAQTITSLHLSVGVVSEPLGVGPLLAAMPSLRRVQLGSFGKRHLKIAQDGPYGLNLARCKALKLVTFSLDNATVPDVLYWLMASDLPASVQEMRFSAPIFEHALSSFNDQRVSWAQVDAKMAAFPPKVRFRLLMQFIRSRRALREGSVLSSLPQGDVGGVLPAVLRSEPPARHIAAQADGRFCIERNSLCGMRDPEVTITSVVLVSVAMPFRRSQYSY